MAELVVSTLSGWGITVTAATAQTLVNFTASALLQAGANALSRSKGSDASRELSVPKSLPSYRTVYGRGARVQGSWAPGWVVDTENGILYGCIILNSRPSDGSNFALYLDRRAVGLSGDPLDFGTMTNGTATVTEGNTTVTVTHGLGATPDAAGVTAWTDDGLMPVDNRTSTTFRVTIPEAAPVGGVTVTWRAVLSTDGGAAVNAPFAGYFNCWLGTGAQQHPPTRILQEWGDLRGLNTGKFWHTDRWSDRTVLWVRMVAGPSESRQERWPSSPPLIEAECDWSKVWDPRDEAQDPDDPATWTVRDNQALCLLDALRANPVSRYPDSQIRLADFTAAADLADELVLLKSGGTERRYRVGGLVIWGTGTELSDALRPLEMAGAGSLMRAGGKIGYAPGAWSAPEITLDEVLREAPIRFRRTRPTRDLPGAIKAVHPDPAANWELAELPPRAVDPAWSGDEDRIIGLDLGLVFSSTQAQRIAKITALRLAAQKELSATFPPVAVQAVAGSTVTVDFPREGDARNGTYRVTRMHPMQFLEGTDGVSLAIPMDLAEEAEAFYAWNHLADEVDRIDMSASAVDPDLPVPVWVSATVDGVDLDLRAERPGTWITDPNNIYTASVDGIRFEFKRNQEPFWLQGPDPLPDPPVYPNGQPFDATITPIQTGSSYSLRVRSVMDDGRVSTWVYRDPVQVGFTLAAPSSISATATAGGAEIDATAPSGTDCAGLQLWLSLTGDVNNGAWFVAEIACDPSDPVEFVTTGLITGTEYSAHLRAVTASGAVSAWASPVTVTPS